MDTPKQEDQTNTKFDVKNSVANTNSEPQKNVVRDYRSGKSSVSDQENSLKRGITNNLVKKVEEYSEKPSLPIKPKVPVEEEWNHITEKKKSTIEYDVEPEKQVAKAGAVNPQKPK